MTASIAPLGASVARVESNKSAVLLHTKSPFHYSIPKITSLHLHSAKIRPSEKERFNKISYILQELKEKLHEWDEDYEQQLFVTQAVSHTYNLMLVHKTIH